MTSTHPMPTADDVAAARRRVPGAFGRHGSARWLPIAAWLLAALYILYLHWYFGLTPARLAAGLGNMWVIIGQMVDWSNFHTWRFAEIFGALGETVAMALLGTGMAAVVALPLSFLGAHRVLPSLALRFGFRRAFDVLRGVDQLIWALVFVRAIGLGPVAGIMAIFVSDTGSLAKLYSEAIEDAERGQMEGIRATGAAPVTALRFGILPQVLPLFVSQALYLFESNVRSATILGIVGAGGIGLQLSERIKIRAWDEVAFMILLIMATVGAIDFASKLIRQRLIGTAGGGDSHAER